MYFCLEKYFCAIIGLRLKNFINAIYFNFLSNIQLNILNEKVQNFRSQRTL